MLLCTWHLSMYSVVKYHESIIIFQCIWWPLHLSKNGLIYYGKLLLHYTKILHLINYCLNPWILAAICYLFFMQCCHPILMGGSRTIPILRHKAWNTSCYSQLKFRKKYLSNVRVRSLWLWEALGIGRGEEKSKAILIQTFIHLHNISWYKQHAYMNI